MLGGGVDVIVILEFCKWQQIVPIVLSLVDKQSKVLFQLLVQPFRLSIPLRVVSCSGR
jgi:hypothetical protein